MRTFTDNAGRNWTIGLNVDAVKRVRELAKVDLLEAIEGKLLEQLSGDPILLCDVLYALVKPTADAQQVSDVDFGRALGGDCLDAATTALLEEMVDFFPKRRRSLLGKALRKFQDVEAKALNIAEARLDSLNVDSALASAQAKLTGSSGN